MAKEAMWQRCSMALHESNDASTILTLLLFLSMLLLLNFFGDTVAKAVKPAAVAITEAFSAFSALHARRCSLLIPQQTAVLMRAVP